MIDRVPPVFLNLENTTNIGQGLAGRETQGLNIEQLGHGMQLKNFACVCTCVCASASACVHLRTQY